MVVIIIEGVLFDIALLVEIVWSMSSEAKRNLLDFLKTLVGKRKQSIMTAKLMFIEDLSITRFLSYEKIYDG